MPVKRIGQLGKLKNEKIAEYCELHAKPWPDLIAALKAAHIGNYSIFLHGDLVFFYLEYSGSDYDADMAALGKTEVMNRWWAISKPCFERCAIDPDCEFTPEIKQVFFCE